MNGARISGGGASETRSFFTWDVIKPLTLSLGTAGCGAKALMAKDEFEQVAFGVGFGLLYSMSIVEGFTSSTWSYLWNIESQEDAKA